MNDILPLLPPMCRDCWTCVRCLDAHHDGCWRYEVCARGHKICPSCFDVWNRDDDVREYLVGVDIPADQCPGCQLVTPCHHCGVEFVRVHRDSAEPYDAGLL